MEFEVEREPEVEYEVGMMPEREGEPEPEVLGELEVEEISLDGICGVY